MKGFLWVVLALFFAARLEAKGPAINFDSQGKPAQDAGSVGQDQEAASRKLLRTTLDAMTCQGAEAVGPSIARLLPSKDVGVIFADQNEKLRMDPLWAPRDGGIFRVYLLRLQKELGSTSPRYLSIFLADGASRIVDRDYPDSAEREYMRLSRMARTWFELGGDRAKLPDFDGFTDKETAEKINVWIENGDVDGVAAAVQKPTLASLLEGNLDAQKKTQALIEKARASGLPPEPAEEVLKALQKEEQGLEAARNAFADFKEQELRWFMAHRPQ